MFFFLKSAFSKCTLNLWKFNLRSKKKHLKFLSSKNAFFHFSAISNENIRIMNENISRVYYLLFCLSDVNVEVMYICVCNGLFCVFKHLFFFNNRENPKNYIFLSTKNAYFKIRFTMQKTYQLSVVFVYILFLYYLTYLTNTFLVITCGKDIIVKYLWFFRYEFAKMKNDGKAILMLFLCFFQ